MIGFTKKIFRKVKNASQVSNSGVVLSTDGNLILENGKQVPVDPSSFLADEHVVFNDLVIPLSDMVPYHHFCKIKRVCTGPDQTLYLYD